MQIITRGLGYTYHVKTPLERSVLHDIHLHIAAGSWAVIIGQTGAGKSTLIKHFNGLLRPTEGEVQVGEERFSSDQKKKGPILFEKVGLLFQHAEQQLFEECVEDDLAFGPRQLGWSNQKIRDNINKIIRLVGLDQSMLTRSYQELSGGEQRRVAIASILVMQPRLLVMDEPTAGLDAVTAAQLMEMLRLWQKETGSTIVHVTHRLEHVADYADQVILLREGKVQLSTTPLQLFTEQVHLLDEMGMELPPALQLVRELNQHIAPSIPLSSPVESAVLKTLAAYYRKKVGKGE